MSNAIVPIKWTHLWDMHSGGGLKEDAAHFFIEAPEDEAKLIFYNRYGHNPDRVSCTCCGSDYSVSESDSLQRASGWHRECAHDASGYIEERDRSSDHYVLDFFKRGLIPKDHKAMKLYRMAIDKGASEQERKTAMDKLMAIPEFPGLWGPPDFVPFEEFERTGRLSKAFGQEQAVIIRAADIKPHERQGSLPEQGYVWLD